MNHQQAAGDFHPVTGGISVPAIPDKEPMQEERLPFTVRLVHSAEDLSKAVQIRRAAYARHVPKLAEALQLPELADFDSDVVVLLAESKLDGSPLGTARIQVNANRPLSVEQSVTFPGWLQGKRMAEVTRLGIGEGRIGILVKMALFKASFEFCELNGIDWMVAAGRAPIDRQYEQLLFKDVFPELGFIPMRHAGNIPHRVMAFEVATAHARWREVNHPLLKFFKETIHMDIDVTRHSQQFDDGEPVTSAASIAEEIALVA